LTKTRLKPNENAIEFECIVIAEVYKSDNFKVYGVDVDFDKYPHIKKNRYDNVSIVGDIHELGISIKYKVTAVESIRGDDVSYKVINIKRDRPNSKASTELFLKEILTENQVDVILAEYPDIVDKIIKNDIDDIDLTKLKGIKEKTFEKIKDKVVANFCLIEIMEEFKGYFTITMLKKLYAEYPSVKKIREELRKDPYKCLINLSGIGFKLADKIILDLDKLKIIDFGYDVLKSKQRAEKCIEYLLLENENNGHTKKCAEELYKEFKQLTPACSHHYKDIVLGDNSIHFNKEDRTLSRMITFNTENYIAMRLIDGLKYNNVWDMDIERYRKDSNGITLTDEQIEALEYLNNYNLFTLNGNAGSGKTSSTNAMLSMLIDNGKTFKLMSPTARAAGVLSEYTGQPASTIHRGLGFVPPNDWIYCENNKLTYDVVVIDEFSMVDIFLFKRVLEAIDFSKTKLLLIGDDAQLQSIGAGGLLYDILTTPILPNVHLTKIFRYGKGGLMTVATQTRNGKRFIADEQSTNVVFGEDKSYIFMPKPQELAIGTIKKLYSKLLSDGYNARDILVLTCQNKGEYGTKELNNHLRPLANDIQNKSCYKHGVKEFYIDDIVMQGVNDYKATIYDEFADEPDTILIPNGEIGTVIKIVRNGIVVDFNGVKILKTNANIYDLTLAYSINIYKIQGSSGKVVILFTPKAHIYMLNANMLYVGQTRAKERVYHIAEPKAVNIAVKIKSQYNRKTNLQNLLIKHNKQTT
jgi:exodeoxyribonuclease V alpha subunit